MKIEDAKVLRAALDAGIAAAERNGTAEVDLRVNLQALDDAARAELQTAIDAAADKPAGG